jgi:hypothetical protein
MVAKNFKDLTGQKFGKLTVVKRANNDIYNRSRWLCKCDCGGENEVLGYYLTSGRTISCGCITGRKKAKMTKYRKIKQMTLDEMVLLLNSCEYCTLWGTACESGKDCEKGITEWLLQEVEE